MAEVIYEVHEAIRTGGPYEAIGEYKGELVRCKDCKYSRVAKKRMSFLVEEDKYECMNPRENMNCSPKTKEPDWYCADGKRR